MTTAAQALVVGVRTLRAAGIEDAPRDARILLAHAIGIKTSRLTLVMPDPLTAEAATRFSALIERRAARQPVSHLIGGREFYGRWFKVTPQVLDPRPETEELVALALQQDFQSVLDLGVGSGCILLSLLAERPAAQGVGVDMSEGALQVAAENGKSIGVSPRLSLSKSDWFSAVTGRFDLIVSNPPYITETEMAQLSPEVATWEPDLALTPGGDGLSPYREITKTAPDYLHAGGRLIVEIGYRQGADVAAMFTAGGFEQVAISQDMSGKDRVVRGVLPS